MRQIIYSIMTVLFLLLVGVFFFNNSEGWSYTDSFYFSTMTLTTVGYGDLVPTTDHSKIFTAIYTLVGIAVMLYVLGSVVNVIIHERAEKFKKTVSKYFHWLKNNDKSMKNAANDEKKG